MTDRHPPDSARIIGRRGARKVILAPLVFAIAIVACGLNGTPATAQSNRGALPELARADGTNGRPFALTESRGLPPLPSGTSVNRAVPIEPAGGLAGFWIVSSRKCRQTAPHGCACGDLEFYRQGECGPPEPVNRDAFHASLAPGAPICIVVHGSFTNWKGLCDECRPVYNWLHGPCSQKLVHFVFYTWPSSGPITYVPHVDVGILGCRASFNSVYLADLIARIPPGHPICLVGHSHGARMVAAALHLLGGGEVDHVGLTYLPGPTQRLRAVLLAAAMDHHWLDPNERFGLALCRTECMLILRNDHDLALSFYPTRKPFSKRALGERGLSGKDCRKLGPLTTKVNQVDVTKIIRGGHLWNHYYSRPALGALIAPYLEFNDETSMIIAPAPGWTPSSTPSINPPQGPGDYLNRSPMLTAPAEPEVITRPPLSDGPLLSP